MFLKPFSIKNIPVDNIVLIKMNKESIKSTDLKKYEFFMIINSHRYHTYCTLQVIVRL